MHLMTDHRPTSNSFEDVSVRTKVVDRPSGRHNDLGVGQLPAVPCW